MAMVMPSYDAFLSSTPIGGSFTRYTPKSLPTITNQALFCSLLVNYSDVGVFDAVSGKWQLPNANNFTVKPVYYSATHVLAPTFPLEVFDDTQLPRSGFDFLFGSEVPFLTLGANKQMYVRLNQIGRYWYSVLRGLGYSCDPFDTNPVSILPLWSFARAYYDLYYPKRYNPWHASNYYYAINRHYNGFFTPTNVGGLYYDLVEKWDCLTSLFGSTYSFDFFATVDDNLVTAASDEPINLAASAPTSNIVKLSSPNSGQNNGQVASNSGAPTSDIPAVNVPASGAFGISADQLEIANKLWSFVSKSSAVGQSVKDWLRVHFGVNPNDDMFSSTHLIESVINDVSINTVVSTAQTSDGGKGDNLGALAGQGYASRHGRVNYEVKTFGFCFCLTSLVPISGVSTGTQPELYLNTYYEQPFAEFDGLGYEILNKSSFIESFPDLVKRPSSISGGFGYVPRLSSYKTLHNIRSGLFSLNSTKDSFIPYCVDVIPVQTMSAGLIWRMPWSMQGKFMSFNRIFYNVDQTQDKVGYVPLDDNFMTQTSFDFSYTSHLKPISDTYSIETLGKDVISVIQQ